MKTTILLTSLVLLISCTSTEEVKYEEASTNAREYLQRLAGDRFEQVVEDNNLFPLFDPSASYEETALAARRAIRWRIKVAGEVESGALRWR